MGFEEAIQRAKVKEGFRSIPYRDSKGLLTIGYGTLIEYGISREEAGLLLRCRMHWADVDLRGIFPAWGELSNNRQTALLDMMYNLGIVRFSGFKKMIQAIKEGNWREAAVQCLDSDYASDVGNRANENADLLEKG